MPAERASMRCVREILRLKHACGGSDRAITKSTGRARSTVADYLVRAAAAGLAWPLPETLSDAALEALLFVGTGVAPGTRRKTEPDWAALARELRRPGVTLMLLWQEYRAGATATRVMLRPRLCGASQAKSLFPWLEPQHKFWPALRL